MKARFTWIVVSAVLCSSGAAAQTDTAATAGATPAMTQDTAGMGAGVVTPTTGTDTAGMGTTGTSPMGDTTSMIGAAPVQPMPEDTAIATTTTTMAVEEEEEGGFNWNWLGLLGLLGLTGLFKKRGTETTIVHHERGSPGATRNDPPGTRPRV